MVLVGLQLMVQKLATKDNVSDLLELLNDTLEPCDIAVTLLNDLLLFDKIESGNMELEKCDIDLREVVLTCCYSFTLQVCISEISCDCCLFASYLMSNT